MKQSTKLPSKKTSLFHEAALRVFPVLSEKRSQSFITVIFTLLALIILGLFAINPTIATILQLNKQISDDTLVYNQLEQKIANLTTLSGEYEDLQPELSLVLAAIPDSYDLPKLMGQLQTLANNNQLEVVTMQSDPVIIATLPTTSSLPVSFSITVQGSQDHVLAFISAFNSFERITTIQKILIEANPTGNNTIDATVEGQAFFLPL